MHRAIRSLVVFLSVSFLLAVAVVKSAEPSTAAGKLSAPLKITAVQDHQHMMDLLNIKSIRPGVSGNGTVNPVNYDESKVNPIHNLPDPLVLKNGGKVSAPQIWWDQRRPEILEDFDREIYGRVPPGMPAVKWEVLSTTPGTVGDAAVSTKQLVGHVDNSAFPFITVDITATLTTPANAAAPVPVIIQLQPGRNPFATTRRAAVSPAQPTREPSWQQQVLSRGWGCATLSVNSIQADNAAGLTQGIIGLMNKGQQRTPDDWGALRAWAWGTSRLLDYLESDSSVDAKRVGIEGHSRYGKATIVAMAYDSRFAICYVSSSGEGGTKIHRRNFGELLENVAGAGEYYWMAGNFIKYAGPLTPDDLPVDSHELIALCAPRPVFLGSGITNGDGWADAKGTFAAGVGAGPVYELLGKKGLGTTEMPAVGTALLSGDVAFRQHPGGHTDVPNWPTFLTFADRYLATRIK